MLLNAFVYFFGIFLFFIIKFVFTIFISFLDEVSNFRDRILTIQKYKLVVSNYLYVCSVKNISWFTEKILNEKKKNVYAFLIKKHLYMVGQAPNIKRTSF